MAKHRHPKDVRVKVVKGNRKNNVWKGAVYHCVSIGKMSRSAGFPWANQYVMSLESGKGAETVTTFVRFPSYWEREVLPMGLPDWDNIHVKVLGPDED